MGQWKSATESLKLETYKKQVTMANVEGDYWSSMSEKQEYSVINPSKR
jgi:hypothetical protein